MKSKRKSANLKSLIRLPLDLPKRVVVEFSCEFSSPMTIFYNSIIKFKEFSRHWVVEYQIPFPNSHPPSSEIELRNIAKTTFFSKVIESFLSEWLLSIVEPYLDPCQYGLKGASINHCLLRFLKFVHKDLDLKDAMQL